MVVWRLVLSGLAGAVLIACGAAHADAPLVLTPSISKVITLPDKAETIIVGNPAHLSVQPANATTLILVPGQWGTTSLTVLGKKGEVIYDRLVTVSTRQAGQITIRRDCYSIQLESQESVGALGNVTSTGPDCAPVEYLACASGTCNRVLFQGAASPESGALPSAFAGALQPQTGVPGAPPLFPMLGGGLFPQMPQAAPQPFLNTEEISPVLGLE